MFLPLATMPFSRDLILNQVSPRNSSCENLSLQIQNSKLYLSWHNQKHQENYKTNKNNAKIHLHNFWRRRPFLNSAFNLLQIVSRHQEESAVSACLRMYVHGEHTYIPLSSQSFLSMIMMYVALSLQMDFPGNPQSIIIETDGICSFRQ